MLRNSLKISKIKLLFGMIIFGWIQADLPVSFAIEADELIISETTPFLLKSPPPLPSLPRLPGIPPIELPPDLPPHGFKGIHWDQLIQQIQFLNSNFSQANQNWAMTNEHIGAANTQWGQTLGEVHTANSNWTDSNVQIAGINQNWADTNEILKTLLAPVHGFEVGASVGVGFALGSAGTSIAIQGVKFGMASLYEAVTHEKRNAKILEILSQARENYPKLVKLLIQLEKQVQSTFYVEKQIRRAGGKVALEQELQGALVKLEILIHGLDELGKNLIQQQKIHELQGIPNGFQGEEASLQTSLTGVQSMFAQAKSEYEQMSNLKKLLEEYTEEKICDQLIQDFGSLVQTENAIQEHRLVLIRALHRQVWEEEWERRERKNLKISQTLQKGSEYSRLRQTQENIAKNYLKKVIQNDPELRSAIYESYFMCLQDNGVEMASHTALRGLVFLTHPRLANHCWKEALNPDSVYARDYLEQLQSILEAERNLTCNIADDLRIEGEVVRSNVELTALAHRCERENLEQLERDQLFSKTRLRLDLLKQKRKEIEMLCGSQENQEGVQSPFSYFEMERHG